MRLAMTPGQDSAERRALERASAEYFELARDLLCTASPDGFLTRVNPAWERALGYPASELVSRPYLELVHPEDRERTHAEAARLTAAGTETVSFENRYRAADGSYHWLEWTARVVDEDGQVFAAARDITEQRRAEEDSRLLAAIVRSTDEAVISTELNGVITSWNRAAERIYGYSPEEMIGGRLERLVPPHRVDEDVKVLAEVFSSKGGVCRLETERQAKDGSLVPVALTASPIRDVEGRLAGVSWIVRDVTDRKLLEAEIEHAARQDPVTGVNNRRHFERELLRQLTFVRRYGSGGALLLLDLDGFRRINDSLGHEAGDRLLGRVADALVDRLRVTDTIARLEADRFAVLLPLTDAEAAGRVAEEIVERVGAVCAEHGEVAGVEVTCSVGIARLEEHAGSSTDEVLAAAALAVVKAKRSGGDRAARAAEAKSAG